MTAKFLKKFISDTIKCSLKIRKSVKLMVVVFDRYYSNFKSLIAKNLFVTPFAAGEYRSRKQALLRNTEHGCL